MSLEEGMLKAAVAGAVVSLALVPRGRLPEMQFVILFVQMPCWVLGLSAVELGLLEYPYRELASANRTSFVFEYFVLPVACVHVYNYFPWRATAPVRGAYLWGIGLALTVFEAGLERYTRLIKYTGWEWYFTWVSVVFIFWLAVKTTRWFFSAADS